jgi:hypothetical protein
MTDLKNMKLYWGITFGKMENNRMTEICSCHDKLLYEVSLFLNTSPLITNNITINKT